VAGGPATRQYGAGDQAWRSSGDPKHATACTGTHRLSGQTSAALLRQSPRGPVRQRPPDPRRRPAAGLDGLKAKRVGGQASRAPSGPRQGALPVLCTCRTPRLTPGLQSNRLGNPRCAGAHRGLAASGTAVVVAPVGLYRRPLASSQSSWAPSMARRCCPLWGWEQVSAAARAARRAQTVRHQARSWLRPGEQGRSGMVGRGAGPGNPEATSSRSCGNRPSLV